MLNRHTLTGRLDFLADDLKLYLTEIVPPNASLSCDQWTDRMGRTYMTVTAQWYDPDAGKMMDCCLELNRFQDHTAEVISEELQATLKRFRLMPTSMTTDNHRSNVNAFNREAWDAIVHVRCVAHTVHRAVGDVLKIPLFQRALADAREVTKWIRRRYVKLCDAVLDPDRPNGPAKRGPLQPSTLADDADVADPQAECRPRYRPILKLPPDQCLTRWSSDLSYLAYVMDGNNRAWIRWLQHGNLMGEVFPLNNSTSIPQTFDFFGPRFEILAALHGLLWDLGDLTREVQSSSKPTLGSAWVHLIGLIILWGRSDDLLCSFEEFDDGAYTDEEERFLQPEPASQKSSGRRVSGRDLSQGLKDSARRKRGRPFLDVAEKQQRQRVRELEKAKAKEAHPTSLIVQGRRSRPDVNYALMDGGFDDGYDESQALSTNPITLDPGTLAADLMREFWWL